MEKYGPSQIHKTALLECKQVVRLYSRSYKEMRWLPTVGVTAMTGGIFRKSMAEIPNINRLIKYYLKQLAVYLMRKCRYG